MPRDSVSGDPVPWTGPSWPSFVPGHPGKSPPQVGNAESRQYLHVNIKDGTIQLTFDVKHASSLKQIHAFMKKHGSSLSQENTQMLSKEMLSQVKLGNKNILKMQDSSRVPKSLKHTLTKMGKAVAAAGSFIANVGKTDSKLVKEIRTQAEERSVDLAYEDLAKDFKKTMDQEAIGHRLKDFFSRKADHRNASQAQEKNMRPGGVMWKDEALGKAMENAKASKDALKTELQGEKYQLLMKELLKKVAGAEGDSPRLSQAKARLKEEYKQILSAARSLVKHEFAAEAKVRVVDVHSGEKEEFDVPISGQDREIERRPIPKQFTEQDISWKTAENPIAEKPIDLGQRRAPGEVRPSHLKRKDAEEERAGVVRGERTTPSVQEHITERFGKKGEEAPDSSRLHPNLSMEQLLEDPHVSYEQFQTAVTQELYEHGQERGFLGDYEGSEKANAWKAAQIVGGELGRLVQKMPPHKFQDLNALKNALKKALIKGSGKSEKVDRELFKDLERRATPMQYMRDPHLERLREEFGSGERKTGRISLRDFNDVDMKKLLEIVDDLFEDKALPQVLGKLAPEAKAKRKMPSFGRNRSVPKEGVAAKEAERAEKELQAAIKQVDASVNAAFRYGLETHSLMDPLQALVAEQAKLEKDLEKLGELGGEDFSPEFAALHSQVQEMSERMEQMAKPLSTRVAQREIRRILEEAAITDEDDWFVRESKERFAEKHADLLRVMEKVLVEEQGEGLKPATMNTLFKALGGDVEVVQAPSYEQLERAVLPAVREQMLEGMSDPVREDAVEFLSDVILDLLKELPPDKILRAEVHKRLKEANTKTATMSRETFETLIKGDKPRRELLNAPECKALKEELESGAWKEGETREVTLTRFQRSDLRNIELAADRFLNQHTNLRVINAYREAQKGQS